MRLPTQGHFFCIHHPNREGVGICMAGCRQVVCEECSTKLEGINTCLNCLKKKVSRTEPRRGALAAFANRLFGMLSVVIGFGAMTALFFGLGLAIANSESALGNKPRHNRKLARGIVEALAQFRQDMGRHPTAAEGLTALVWNQGTLGPIPDGYHGPYLPRASSDCELRDGIPLDAYGTPFRLIIHPDLPAPVLLSAGGDKAFETDSASLSARFTQGPGVLSGDGDDLVAMPR